MMVSNYLLWIVLPNISAFFAIVGIIGAMFTAVFFMVEWGGLHSEQYEKDLCISTRRVMALFISMLFMSCLLPSTKQLIQLKVIETVSELKGVDQIPQKMVDRINDLLDLNNKGD